MMTILMMLKMRVLEKMMMVLNGMDDGDDDMTHAVVDVTE